jgi:hypothetical protein
MSWASVAEVKTLCLQIAGDASITLPTGWDTRAAEAVAETKAQIRQALGLRGFTGAALDNADNLKGLHLDLSVFRLLSVIASLDMEAVANLERLDRSAELALLLPLDAAGEPVGGGSQINGDIPQSTTVARDRTFGAPSSIVW